MVSMDSRTLHGQRQSRGGEDHRQRQSEVLEDLEPRGPQTSRTSNLVLYLVCPIGRYWAFVIARVCHVFVMLHGAQERGTALAAA